MSRGLLNPEGSDHTERNKPRLQTVLACELILLSRPSQTRELSITGLTMLSSRREEDLFFLVKEEVRSV